MSKATRRLIVVSGLALVGLVGCGEPERDVRPEPLWSAGQGPRVVLDLTLDTLFHRHGRTDSLLVNPALPRHTDAGVAILDRIEQEVTVYAEDGTRLWTAGGVGGGPGELRNVRDLQATESGELIVYDVGNGKLATLDVFTGQLRSELRLPEDAGTAESMVPLGDSILLVTLRADEPLAVVSVVDGSVERLAMPWPGFSRLHALHRQGITAAEGSRWTYLFRYGNGFFPFQGTEPMGYLGQFVEHLPFPALSVSVTPNGRSTSFVDSPVCSACSASLVGDTLFVHFGGETELAARILDAYDARTGAYLVSYRLPTFFKYVEVARDWIAGVREDPYPELMLLSRGQADDTAEARPDH